VCARARACVRACARARARACVRAHVCVCVCVCVMSSELCPPPLSIVQADLGGGPPLGAPWAKAWDLPLPPKAMRGSDLAVPIWSGQHRRRRSFCPPEAGFATSCRSFGGRPQLALQSQIDIGILRYRLPDGVLHTESGSSIWKSQLGSRRWHSRSESTNGNSKPGAPSESGWRKCNDNCLQLPTNHKSSHAGLNRGPYGYSPSALTNWL
jgi:hypothetical protein